MPTETEPLVYESILERDGVRVSKSPWGPDDEIGRLNWITGDSRKLVLEAMDASTIFDLSDAFVQLLVCNVAPNNRIVSNRENPRPKPHFPFFPISPAKTAL